jgi:hypothetical protein
LVLGGCGVERTPHDHHRDGSPVAPVRATAADGRFFSRGARGDEHPLIARQFSARVTTGPGTVRSHLVLELGTSDDDQREAIVRLAVPPGAAVTGAILWVHGKPMNGALIERQRATNIYQSIVARRRDPALVTWDGPGWLAISIFPVSRKEPRLFELEWVEPAASAGGQVRYRVPALREGGQLIARAALEVDGRKVPDGAEVAIGPAIDHPMLSARVPGDPFHALMARTPEPDGAPRLVLVAETSAAMTVADRIRQRAAIEAVLQALPPAAKVTILAADWDASPLAEDTPSSGWAGALEKLDDVVSAGALHLERVLLAAAERARARAATAVLFIGHGRDGFPGDGLRAPLTALRAANLRLSVIGTGPPPPPLAEAASLTGGEYVSVAALDPSLPALLTALQPRPAPPATELRGAGQWHALATITGQTVWLARSLEAPKRQPTAGDGGVAAAARLADLLALWDRARLPWRDQEVGATASATALTPTRALLVLESAQDYRRFGIALPEAGTTPHGKMAANLGVILQYNGGAADQAPAEGGSPGGDILGSLMAGTVDEAQVAGLGLVATGSRGGGDDPGIGLGNLETIGAGGRGAAGKGGKRARGPEVVLGQPRVRGSIDKEIVRRIIRRHLGEVRFCYESGLVGTPGLAGRVGVQFTIAATGQVTAAVLQHSSLGNVRVEGCIVQAVRRWEFPRIESGGLAIVSHFFDLTPHGTPRTDHEPPPQVAPEPEATAALALLAGNGTLAERTTRIAGQLGLTGISDPESLAWTIDRQAIGPQGMALIARLLAAAGRTRDAIRILSERAAPAAEAMAAELHRLGADADAAEVRRLARRGW